MFMKTGIVDTMSDSHFVVVRQRDGSIHVDGQRECSFGRKIERRGENAPEGVFAWWRYEDGLLEVAVDRYGMYPLYYFEHDGVFGVSPSILKLIELGAPKDADVVGLSVFLRIGFFLGERTPFKHIHAMPPGGRLRWNGALCIESGFDFPKERSITREQAVDGYIDLFRESIAQSRPETGTVAVPLSGGKDSRHILLELCRQGARPAFAVTAHHYPPRSNDDVEIAKQISARLGLRHLVLKQTEPRLEAEMFANERTNFCSDEHSWAAVLARTLSDTCNVVYDGIAGDSLSESIFSRQETLCASRESDLYRFAENLVSKSFSFNESVMEYILDEDFKRQLPRDMAIAEIVLELGKYINTNHPVKYFYFMNRARREIALVPFSMYSKSIDVFAPYLNSELHDFLRSIPNSIFLEGGLHREAIRKAFPDFFDIRYENGGANKISDFEHNVRFCRDVLKSFCFNNSRSIDSLKINSRLMWGSVNDGYGSRTRWFIPMYIYMSQLDKFIHY